MERLRKDGRLEELREDVATRQAVELLVREATPISVEQAKARQKLWTPGKDEAETEGARPSASSGPRVAEVRRGCPRRPTGRRSHVQDGRVER